MTPLVATDEQRAALAEAAAPSVMLAHLLDINHGVALPGNPAEQHRWASDARRSWRSAGNLDEIVLRWLTSAVLATGGQVLRQPRLPSLIGGADPGAIRDGLRSAVNEHHERVHRISNRKNT